MPLYAVATKRYMPRCWQDAAGLADRQFFTIHKLPEAARPVLMSLDGASDFESFAFTPGQRKMLRMLIDKGYAEVCSLNAPCSPFQRPRSAQVRCLQEVHWAITGRCNLQCRHCFMESPSGRYAEPAWNELRQMVEQFVSANIPFVSLTGGEPLLHPAFGRLVTLLSQNGIAINQIATNGVALDDACLAMLLDAGQKPMFQISFDGVGRHDQMRGVPGTEAAALDAIGRCAALGCFTAVTSVFSRENIDALTETYEWLRDMGISMWMISRAQTAGLWQGGAAALSTGEMGQALYSLQRRWLQDGKPLHILMGNFFDARPDSAPLRHPIPPYHPQSPECPETMDRVFLLPDGKLLPCPGFTGTTIAGEMPGLWDMTLGEAVTDSALSRFCGDEKALRLSRNPQCQTCDYFTECGMGCRAYALTEGGSATGADPWTCELYQNGWKKHFAQAEREFTQREC
ncbi:MAG: radical SAM protein [Bacillota bacterium]